MSWLDQLRPASFRGVPFQVDTIAHEAGDNVVMREYPFQDLPTVFRMGEAAEEIKLSAYVIGDDYDEQREALRQVLSGEGVLIHPTAGSMRVFVAGKYAIKEAPTTEGGMARFDLTFIRAESRRYPTGEANGQQEAADKAAAAKMAAREAFAAQWSLTAMPGWVSDRALSRLDSSIVASWGKLATATQGFGDYSSQMLANYAGLRANLNDLVRTPAQLADQVATLFELPTEVSQAQARDLRAAFEWVFDLDERIRAVDFEVSIVPPVGEGLVMFGTGTSAVPAGTGTSRAQLDKLTTASDQLFETLATAAWVECVSRIELDNYDEALQMRSAFAAQASRLLREDSTLPASATPPASSWHDAMMALQTAALGDLQARSRDLVRLTTYTPESWQPVWYVSYRLFGTIAWADEIMAMNPHIRHPLLVPPGKALRIVRHE